LFPLAEGELVEKRKRREEWVVEGKRKEGIE